MISGASQTNVTLIKITTDEIEDFIKYMINDVLQIDVALIMVPADEIDNSGITIACTKKEFLTDKLRYIIIDVKGHKDLIKNMIDDTSQTDTGLTRVLNRAMDRPKL